MNGCKLRPRSITVGKNLEKKVSFKLDFYAYKN